MPGRNPSVLLAELTDLPWPGLCQARLALLAGSAKSSGRYKGRSVMLCQMGMLDATAGKVAAGATVELRPSGSSMVPLIRSRQRVTVAPVDPARLDVGDIVLARVAGTVYLHLVSAVDHARKRVQISNNRGRVNGWTSHDRVFGICVAVDDVPRPGADGKTVSAGGHQPV